MSRAHGCAGVTTVVEGHNLRFVLNFSEALPVAALAHTVVHTLSGDTDFLNNSNMTIRSVSTPDGATSHAFNISTNNDDTDEPNGTVTLTINNFSLSGLPGSGTIGTPSSASVTITDNDGDDTSDFGNSTTIIINKITNSARPRPYPFSLWTPRLPGQTEASYLESVSDYTAWVGLADQTYTKRHLPPASKEFVASLPDIKDVLELFRRSESSYRLSRHTSVFFPFFAQWFTDSFLRTDGGDWHKNTSNHEIDLCQIYGLRESVADILRKREGGKLKSQIINGEEYPVFLCEEKDGEIFIKEEFKNLPNMQKVIEGFKTRFCVKAGIDKEEQKRRLLNFFVAGLDRANSSIGYSMINTIFLRAHNKICEELSSVYTQWDDERLFQTTRNILIVILLKIVVVDYIKHTSGGKICAMPPIGFSEKQKWYRKNWIAVEFSLLYRWHILLPNKLTLKIGDTEEQGVDYKQFMYNSSLLTQHGVGALAAAWSKQAAGAGRGFSIRRIFLCMRKNLAY